jgi:hypothetical protein
MKTLEMLEEERQRNRANPRVAVASRLIGNARCNKCGEFRRENTAFDVRKDGSAAVLICDACLAGVEAVADKLAAVAMERDAAVNELNTDVERATARAERAEACEKTAAAFIEHTLSRMPKLEARAETAEAALAVLREAASQLGCADCLGDGWNLSVIVGPDGYKEHVDCERCAPLRAALAATPADLCAERDARIRAETLREAATVIRGIRNASPNPFAALREAACGLETMADEAERGAR